jgi:uncharacterized cupredoxin-like copper-binding protein
MKKIGWLGVTSVTILALVAAGCGGGSSDTKTPATQSVGVALAEYSISPDTHRISAGKITFSVDNTGKQKHEFVVLRTDTHAGLLPKEKGEASEEGSIGEIGDLEPGQSKTITFDLAPGHYAFICNLPGHYTGGMHANFNVD